MGEMETLPPALIVALGASNTAGYGVDAANAYPAIVERLLQSRGIAAVVINSGISGNTTGEMLARLDSAVPRSTRVVLFQPGSNDARLGIPEAERERNIARITSNLVVHGIIVIKVAKAFAAARPVHLQPDGVHYTEAGHDLIARHLIDQVIAALRP